MEKYGVVLDDEISKVAAEGRNCPKCGRDLSDQPNGHGGRFIPPYYCPNCGTEPFEKKPEGK